jgi:predicted porin
MKKTLVALAVIAASGAAFAQATLTGGYTFGYQTTTNAAGVKSAGLGTDGASMQLTATEDLGGGLKATARVSLGGMQRDGAGAGEDAYLQLSGGFGTVKMGTFESCNGLQGLGGAGAPTWNIDNGTSLSGCSNIDNIGWTSNDMGGLKFRAGYTDRGTASGTGLGAGTDGTANAQSSLSVGVAYAAGGLGLIVQ